MNSYQEQNNSIEKSEFRENLAVLREISFFSEFPLELLKVFAYLCTREHFKKGDNIFRQNDDDGRAYCILTGEAKLSRTYKEKLVGIRTCAQNSFFGALILAGQLNRFFSLTATRDTNCLVLARTDFLEAVSQFPGAKQYIIQGLIDNISSWEKRFLVDNMDCESCRTALGVSLI